MKKVNEMTFIGITSFITLKNVKFLPNSIFELNLNNLPFHFTVNTKLKKDL